MSMQSRLNNPLRSARVTVACAAVAMLLCVGTMMGAATSTAAAQTSAWSAPKQLSAPNQRSWFPAIMADATGRVHVMYSSGIRNRSVWDTVMYTASPDGLVWQAPIDIFATDPFGAIMASRAPAATRPEMVLDLNGNVHVGFRDDQTLYYDNLPIQSFGSPSTLQPTIVSKSDVPYFSKMVVDGKGTIHYIYTENVQTAGCTICYRLYYRHSMNLGKSWSPTISISDPEIGATKPTIVVDKQNNVHVVWEAGRGGALSLVEEPTRVIYAASYDGGTTWSAPLTLPSNQVGDQARFITIGVDGQDHLVTAWLGQPRGQVFYQVSSDHGRQWSAPQPIQGVLSTLENGTLFSRLTTFNMATDSAGTIHLVLVGRTNPAIDNNSVLHLTWNGTAWSQPDVIVTDDKNVFEWPVISVGLGNQLHVAWFLRDQAHIFDSDNGLYSIWYSRSSALAPATAPAIYPTPTPLPTPTPMAALVTVVPTAPPVSSTFTPVAISSIVGEGQSMGIIALAAVPVLVLSLLVFLLRRRR